MPIFSKITKPAWNLTNHHPTTETTASEMSRIDRDPPAQCEDDRLYGPILSALPPEIRQRIWTEVSVHPDHHAWNEAPTETYALCGHFQEHKLYNLPLSCYLNRQVRHDAIRRSIPRILMYTMPISSHGVYHMRHTMRDVVKHMPGLKKVRICLSAYTLDRVNYQSLADFYQFCYFYANKLEIKADNPHRAHSIHAYKSAHTDAFWKHVADAASWVHEHNRPRIGEPAADHRCESTDTLQMASVVFFAIRSWLRHDRRTIEQLLDPQIIEDVVAPHPELEQSAFFQKFGAAWDVGYLRYYSAVAVREPEHAECERVRWQNECLDKFLVPEPWIDGEMYGVNHPNVSW